MENKSVKSKSSKASNLISGSIILFCLIVGYTVWEFIMGNPVNFENNDPSGSPLPGNYLGVIYKGGIIVSILMGLLLTCIVFSIERFFVISRSSGKGNLDKFVNKIQALVSEGKTKEAREECSRQQGSVANVVDAALVRFEEVRSEGVGIDKASESLQKEIEEATSLEMPMLQSNMAILATLVSIGTLLGLLGTVSGMIKAFAGLAVSGTPDQAQLATGISEALINTAIGIATSALSTIMYNYFTSKIDTLTYFIDEAGFAITQSYKKITKAA